MTSIIHFRKEVAIMRAVLLTRLLGGSEATKYSKMILTVKKKETPNKTLKKI